MDVWRAVGGKKERGDIVDEWMFGGRWEVRKREERLILVERKRKNELDGGQIKAFEERIRSQFVERQMAVVFERYSFEILTTLPTVLASVVGLPQYI
jgi:hypothetical protein